MNRKLQHYVGRIVRLNKHVFEAIRIRAIRNGHALENSFLVARVSQSLQTLICYGSNFRIVVNVADAVLV